MRDWLKSLDEIDSDCVHQYEYLLGRKLNGYEEYHEIDSQVDEMILEWDSRKEFFKAYPDLKKYSEIPLDNSRLDAAKQCLIDSGIKADEAETVLQALGHILLDRDLFPAPEERKSLKAIHIEWDIDSDEEIILPTEIEIPYGITDGEKISDYLSDVTGFCHKGYQLVETNILHIMVESWADMQEKYPMDRSEMTEEEEAQFVEDCFKLYEKEGFSPMFWSPFSDNADRIGLPIKIIGRIEPDSIHDLSCLPMWRARLDGSEFEVFPEEVIPSEMRANGCTWFANSLEHGASVLKPSINTQIQSAANRTEEPKANTKEPELHH